MKMGPTVEHDSLTTISHNWIFDDWNITVCELQTLTNVN
jgi:hypothetical protein